MNYFHGNLLYTSTGLYPPIPVYDMDTYAPFTPKFIHVTTGKKPFASLDSLTHLSLGHGRPEWQHVTSIFQDGNGGRTHNEVGLICNHMVRIGGVITEAQKVRLVAFPPNAVQFEVLTMLAFFGMEIEAWG